MNTMLEISPQRKLLNYQQFTPAKINVCCQINGWLQTYKKSSTKKQIKKNNPRFHSRYLNNAKFDNKQVPLKLIKAQYLQQNPHLITITKQKIQQSLSTKCKTSQIPNRSHKKPQIPQIKISDFDTDYPQQLHSIRPPLQPINTIYQPLNKFNHFLQIKQIASNSNKIRDKNVLLTDRMQQRQKRMNKLLSYNRMKSLNSKGSQNMVQFTRKVQLINKSQEIIQGKLNLNQKRTLNMIIRKSVNTVSVKQIMNQSPSHNFIRNK